MIFSSLQLNTPLGPMIAIGDHQALYLLEFVDRAKLERKVEQLRKRAKATIIPGSTPILQSIASELTDYFSGDLRQFETPVSFLGSDFQHGAWKALQQIPFGNTCSYAQMACSIGRKSAYRAVANANGANLLSIIVPCHRVINKDGKLGGYGGGLSRKEWLLMFESNC